MPPELPNYVGEGSFAAFLIGAAAAAYKWLKPLVEDTLRVIPEIKDICDKNAAGVDVIAKSMKDQSEAFQVIARIISQMALTSLKSRNVILLVEDARMDALLVERVCSEFTRRFRLHFAWVTTLDEAISEVRFACVVILDLGLPDNGESAKLQAFVDAAPCPVVVFSGTKCEVGDFPNAFAVLHKPSDSDKLKDIVEAAIMGRPAMRSQ